MVSSFPRPGLRSGLSVDEAQSDARRAPPRLLKERDGMIVAPQQERRKSLPS
jgi:hypothetical protein